ncbi:hypothetical protein CUC53_04665 [Aeromonas cavernicola]|uniref:Outer membrane assembly lipoprotein YfiO n=1 Tax=Aeromonas cavernicola TaxID=1006623 RepID=A0A2H9U7E6_9GAMM|nr:hypothetical protein CUC53_04665 [Aeromonas cavernicola]
MALATVLVSSYSFASIDGDGCSFWHADCPLPAYPLFLSDNDTKSNLLMLLADKQRLALPFMLPADPVNQRDREIFSLQRLPLPDEVESPELREQLVTRLTTYDPSLPALLAHYAGRDSLYGRAISNSLQSVGRFLDALEQSDVAAAERAQLLTTRLQILGQQEDSPQPVEVTMSEPAKEWQAYLDAVRQFYDGHFSEALAGFMALQKAKAPWVAETVNYMVMRTYLNAAMKEAQDEYGGVDLTKSDHAALKQAMMQGQAYLAAYPQGRYASSTKGMFRRIIWMSGDQARLRDSYSEAIAADHSLPELEALVNEIDLALLSADAYRNELAYQDNTQPELLFINALRGLRTNGNQQPYWSDEQLDAAIKQLQAVGNKEEATYLQAYLLLQKQQFDAVLALLPATEGQHTSTLAFSRQLLRIWALQGSKAFEQAEQALMTLIAAPLPQVQQAFVENMLADQWVATGKTAAIFDKGSPVTQLRIRSVVLKQSADPALLRHQAQQATSSAERQIALHTLLVRDLIAEDYPTFLKDVTLIPADYKELTPPKDAPWQPLPNEDVRLSAFQWRGDSTPQGYYCQDLTTTLGTLVQRPEDGHALNCLGEYLRNKEPNINLWQGKERVWGLPEPKSATAPSRLKLYQAVIANPQAEPEDKSYALYRAINCYAPSGYNGCDQQEIPKNTRQAWFNTLKQRYGNSVWAKSLKYFW